MDQKEYNKQYYRNTKEKRQHNYNETVRTCTICGGGIEHHGSNWAKHLITKKHMYNQIQHLSNSAEVNTASRDAVWHFHPIASAPLYTSIKEPIQQSLKSLNNIILEFSEIINKILEIQNI